MASARFSVIIPVLNSLSYLDGCLRSVREAAARAGNAEIIVVDNGSTDGSWERLQREQENGVTVLRLPGATIAAVRNRGAREARGEILCFIDCDCTVASDYFASIDKVLRENPTAGTGSLAALPENPHWLEAAWWELHRLPDGFVHYMASANFIVRRDAFEAIGGFDESLTTGEDSEIGRKLNAAGHRIYEAREIRVAHHRNPKSLGAFFRQQLWHSRGMFGATKQSRWNKAVLMTVAHIVLLVSGILAAVLLPAPFWVRVIVLLACLLAAPVLTVLYRFRQAKRIHHPLTNIFLYFLYYIARGWVLLRLVLGGESAR